MPNEDVEQGNQNAVIGPQEHPQHRAGPGEGVRAQKLQDGADHPEFSVFDGKGNESVVVLTEDEEGRPTEGTGPSSAAAADNAKSGARIGQAF